MILDLITCEYPPDLGGVGDYTRQVAMGLSERGNEVYVWTRSPRKAALNHITGPVHIKEILGALGPIDMWRIQRLWNREGREHQILLQWAPSGYGCRGMNLPFALWISLRVLQGDTLRVMFHEAFYEWTEPRLRRKMASIVHRLMSALLLNFAKEVFVSTPYVAAKLSRLKIVKNVVITHLPIPSNVIPPDQVTVRSEVDRPSSRIGYFGTYHPDIQRILIPALEHLMHRMPHVAILLIGAGSEVYRASISANFRQQVTATGPCSLAAASAAIHSCDLMFQPYPEGVNTRRGTAMAALAHGKLLVSTTGRMTEPVWSETTAIRLLPSLSPALMAEELGGISASLTREQLVAVSSEAKRFYERHFSIQRVLAVLSSCYTTT